MYSILVSFLQDVAQGIYGESDLTYKEIYDFDKIATPKQKRTIKGYQSRWYDKDIDDINTAKVTNFVRKTLAAS